MRSARLWAGLLGLVKVVVEGVEFDEVEQVLVVSVRPRKATKRRCGRCGKRCPGYDQGQGRRRWRTLDLGTIVAFLEADSPRVRCAEHGVVAAQVPWARHDAGHTYAFDETAAWLVTHCSKSAVRDLLRIAWRTVGSIVTRVVADAEANTDRFANLRRTGRLGNRAARVRGRAGGRHGHGVVSSSVVAGLRGSWVPPRIRVRWVS
ncbi:MAG TPA: transposase family protein, partial [Dermatophilaceae bacterium]|nr:transposase family protein [Dermatophilaceae bacterium]